MIPDIRLVAIDLDGTLLDDRKEVGHPTATALRSLPQRGVKVVIASARPPRSVRPFYRLLELDTLQINYNGALIWDEPRGTAYHHRPMMADVVRRIVAHARDVFPQVLVSCEVMDRWYTDRFEPKYNTETGKLFKPDHIGPVEGFLNQPITKLMLLGEPSLLASLGQTLANAYESDVTVIRCDRDLLQIMQRGASKAAALRNIAEHYGVAMRQVMAIGDASNDLEMLQESGVGVAMDNADPVLKQIADWIAPSNNDHGVHAALRQYGLT